ncbi:MAG TPA: hypothetical protein VM450_02025 [Thermomicrobiales bacterium]|jgi:hypothetical protein|nr:hypothetical protein [Thermomicrobiales bacterium]
MDRTSQTSKAVGSDTGAGEPGMSISPSEAEVEAWAERVRKRRQAWVDGPTEEEKHDWQRRERARRAARLEPEAESGAGNGERKRLDPYEERLRLQRRYTREVRLATEGIGVWFATWPFRVLADLVVTGQEWEEDTLHSARRRWIPFSDDDM